MEVEESLGYKQVFSRGKVAADLFSVRHFKALANEFGNNLKALGHDISTKSSN